MSMRIQRQFDLIEFAMKREALHYNEIRQGEEIMLKYPLYSYTHAESTRCNIGYIIVNLRNFSSECQY